MSHPPRSPQPDELPGRVVAFRTAEIRPQVGGIIQRRLFEQGAAVRTGQILFQISPAPYRADADTAQATVQKASAAYARARAQADRLKPLVAADAISRPTMMMRSPRASRPVPNWPKRARPCAAAEST